MTTPATTTTTNGTTAPTGAAAPSAFSEAPASATVRAVHAASNFEWLITTRCDSTRDLLARIEHITSWLCDNGWTPATARPSTTTAAAAAPICPEHGSPMRPAKRGGWFCPVEVGKHPQTGKAFYCEHRA